MQKLYEPANALEGHMIVDLLKQEGIEAVVEGGFLQGAIGELPANALVRVMVEEENYDAARLVIDRWNAAVPVDSTPPKPVKQKRRWPWYLAGIGTGAAAMWAWAWSPAYQGGVDYNGDGRPDEIWTYGPNRQPLKMEADRNLDGKVDLIMLYGANGQVSSAESDDNFDGVFETRSTYRAGNIQSSEADTDGDGFIDTRWSYTFGVLSTIQYVHPKTGVPIKTEFYKAGILTHSELDTDGDGKMDRRTTYDKLGESAKAESLKQAP